MELIIDPPGSGFVAAIPPFSPYAPGTSVTLGGDPAACASLRLQPLDR